MSFITYGRQTIEQEDVDAVVEALQSDWLTQGPAVKAFEEGLLEYCGANYGVAACNATACLHIACLALGLGKDDVLWTSPNTFVASANCAHYCGAKVDFVDIDPYSLNMSAQKLSEKLKLAKQNNCLPNIVIPVHFAGQSCDMQEIRKLSNEYGFKIIEDASHAIGGKYQNKFIGNCQYSDVTVFSFHPVKIMTTGEGGLATTNDPEIAKKMQLYRSHCVTRDDALMNKPSEGKWYYQQISLGYNYRITDLQCALGLSQMRRVNNFVKRRNELANRYNDLLKELPLILPQISKENYSAFHLYVIQVDSGKTNKSRKEIFDFLQSKNIGVNVHYIPVHLQPYYQQFGSRKGDFPNAENYYHHAITLPLFYTLSESEQDYIVNCLKEVLL